ncbi:MAG: hypothetical protein AAB458_03215 [Patescibacteria group bacterium]
MFKFENIFNREAKDESKEAHLNTGRSEEVTEDISETQEKITESNERFDKITDGVEKIMPEILEMMKKDGAQIENIMDYEKHFVDKLQENGFITASDMSFASIDDAVRQAIKKVTRSGYDRWRKELTEREAA